MKIFIVICSIILLACLVAEKILATRHRFTLRHVIHVNGTRGKSGVTRLIAAGLFAGKKKVYCKTTGTIPMIIDTKGNEKEIKRIGPANILEQIKTLKDAASDGAEILVVECMAVDPELQYVCEHKILKSDIGVITNARVDHVAEMGETPHEVCEALSNTIPQNGKVFTSEKDLFEIIKQRAKENGSIATLSSNYDFDTSEFLFPENIALALDVCEACGVDRKVALEGMKNVKADPYESASFPLGNEITFVNGMSANDPQSTKMVLEKFSNLLKGGDLIYILNNRPDRGYRTNLMIDFISDNKPDAVWLMGRGSRAAAKKLEREGIKTAYYKTADDLPLRSQKEGSLIFAIGNIANEGLKLMDIVEGKEEEKCTDK